MLKFAAKLMVAGNDTYTVFVNPLNIVAVYPQAGLSIISTVDGRTIIVAADADEVVAMITRSLSRTLA